MGPLRLWLASPRRSTLLLVCNGTRQTTHYQNYSAPTLLSRPTSASYTTNWLLLPSPVTVSSRTASNYALQIKRESHNGPLVSTRWICKSWQRTCSYGLADYRFSDWFVCLYRLILILLICSSTRISIRNFFRLHFAGYWYLWVRRTHADIVYLVSRPNMVVHVRTNMCSQRHHAATSREDADLYLALPKGRCRAIPLLLSCPIPHSAREATVWISPTSNWTTESRFQPLVRVPLWRKPIELGCSNK